MKVVAKNRDAKTGNDVLWFKCPGCDMTDKHPPYHRIPVSIGTRLHPGTMDERKTWEWNGSLEKPTINPSVNHPGVCHFFIREGVIEFCSDSDHPLKGQKVPLPEFTEW